MNSKKLIALCLVFALTGSAMASHSYDRNDTGVLEDVQLVQQHTVFVEIVLDKDVEDDIQEIHEFGAVVGYAVECFEDEAREVFDNAVLWFNDQFLFGNKSSQDIDRDQCWVPELWAIGIGSNDIHSSISDSTPVDDRPALVKELIELDNDCFGCIFEYEGTFYTTDPNGNTWMVDKLVYPVSLGGNLFESGSGDDCHTGASMSPLEDPRSPGAHADECRDRPEDEPDANHQFNDGDTSDGDGEPLPPLVEPLYITHLQVDGPEGFGDDGEAPASEALQDPTLAEHEAHMQAPENNGQYTFLLAVDFVAFEDQPLGTGNYTSHDEAGNVTHENATYEDGDTLVGDSHGEHDDEGYGDDHRHSTVNLDIFLHHQAPYFVETHNVWEEDPNDAGQTPQVNPTCSGMEDPPADPEDDPRDGYIQDRSVIVCDTTQNTEMHKHDGSQTTYPVHE